MKFGTFLIIVIVGYMLYYAWLVFADLFLTKEHTVEKIGEEEEIEISDQAEEFQPETISKKKSSNDNSVIKPISKPINTGAIKLDDFISNIDDFAENGEFNLMGSMVKMWGATVV